MKYVTVLDGTSSTIGRQAEQLKGFLRANHAEPNGECIILYDQERCLQYALSDDVILVKISRYQPEVILCVLNDIICEAAPDVCIFPGNFFGHEIASRLALRIGGSALTSAASFTQEGETLICRKAVYTGYLRGVFELRRRPFCISADPAAAGEELMKRTGVSVRDVDASQYHAPQAGWMQRKREENPAGLESSSWITAAGRGAGSRETVMKLERLSTLLGAEFGVTRAAAMNGWAAMNRILGVSGVIAGPDVSIIFGASGSPAFRSGIEQSKCIISVNHDEHAPIISFSDAAVIGDCEDIIDELLELVKEDKFS